MAKIVEMRPPPKTENLGPKVQAHTRYYLGDGTLVPGVTTVVRVLGFNTDVLVKWANREGLAGRDTTKIKDETAAIGSLAHYLIESELKGEEPDLADYTPAQLERAQHALKAFHEWKRQQDFHPQLVEGRLVSEEHGYGGTVDCWGMIQGLPHLLDFKTARGIWFEHRIQVSAYWKLLQENGYDVRGVRILRIPRTPDEGFEEHVITGQQVLTGWRIFQRALDIYRLEKELRGGVGA